MYVYASVKSVDDSAFVGGGASSFGIKGGVILLFPHFLRVTITDHPNPLYDCIQNLTLERKREKLFATPYVISFADLILFAV